MAKIKIKSHYKQSVRKKFEDLPYGQIFNAARSGPREYYMKLDSNYDDAENALSLNWYSVVNFKPGRMVTPVKAIMDIEYEL